jgi:hypothetical protein
MGAEKPKQPVVCEGCERRARMITDLRRHRDALLEALARLGVAADESRAARDERGTRSQQRVGRRTVSGASDAECSHEWHLVQSASGNESWIECAKCRQEPSDEDPRRSPTRIINEQKPD